MGNFELLSAGWEVNDWSVLEDWTGALQETAYYVEGGTEAYIGDIYSFVQDAAKHNDMFAERLSSDQLAHVNYIAKSLIVSGAPNIADSLYPEEYDDDLYVYESLRGTNDMEALNG